MKDGLAFIFDFDGVIALSEPIHMRAWGETAELMGKKLSAGFETTGIGATDLGLSKKMVELWGLKTEPKELLKLKCQIFQDQAAETPLVPGIKEALMEFSKKYSLAIATNAYPEDIRPILNAHELTPYFKVIATINDVTKPKPDPEVFQFVMHKLGVSPKDTWIFEDSHPGVQAAITSGANVVAVATTLGPQSHREMPHRILDFTELEKIRSWLTL